MGGDDIDPEFDEEQLAERELRYQNVSFPADKNPYLDVYTLELTAKIGKWLGVEGKFELRNLRLDLCEAFEECTDMSLHIGGINLKNPKKRWTNNVLTTGRRLVGLLEEFDANKPLVEDEFEAEALGEFGEFLIGTSLDVAEFIDEFEYRIKNPISITSSTAHSLYLRRCVLYFTDVFLNYRSENEITRVYSRKKVDGLFPEFIRMSAVPFLKVNYKKANKCPEKFGNLNRQIQHVVTMVHEGKLR